METADGRSLSGCLPQPSQGSSTQATYAAQRNQFQQFCDMLGVHGDDCFTVDTICRWIMGRSANHYKLSTIELGLHAIADMLPSRSMIIDSDVLCALRAAARQPSAVRKQKLPILMSLLRQLVPAEPEYWRQARDFAFWLLAWYGLFRSSELVNMQWEDISVHDDEGLVMSVARSKTDQAMQGHHVFVHSAPEHDSVICPLRALHRLAEFQQSGLSGPVFRVHESVAEPVSKRTMLARLHRSLHALGQPHELFGLHSFRSGGATAASAAGVPIRLIKAHGRWVSDVVRIYTCALPGERWQVSASMHDGDH